MIKYTLIVSSLFLAACNGQVNSNENQAESNSESVQTEVIASDSLIFKSKGIQNIYSTYSLLRDALVATDFKTAKEYALTLKTAFEQEEKWQEASLAAAIKDATEIGLARESFYNLNTAFEAILKDNIESGKINKCYCPMARDNKGATWFSTDTEINNPYFGDKMLKCGKITETIQ